MKFYKKHKVELSDNAYNFALYDVIRDTLGDPDRRVSDWIYDRFYFVFDDAREMIRHFARWGDARKSFVDIISMEAAEDQSLEILLDEFVRNIY